MALRFYLADVIGAGTDANPYRSVATDLARGTMKHWVDGRANPAVGGGRIFVGLDVSPAQHAALIADARITYFPFEDAGGAPLALSSNVGQIPVAKRTTITNIADAHHVPLSGIQGTDPIRFVVRRFRMRLLLRQFLSDLDLTEGLDTVVSAIPVARRQAINARLTASGFNSRDAGVVGSDTIREAILKMILEREESDRGD